MSTLKNNYRASSGLWAVGLPKTGHTLNLEDPSAFNALLAEFFAQVEAGRWLPRDSRALPGQIMRTK